MRLKAQCSHRLETVRLLPSLRFGLIGHARRHQHGRSLVAHRSFPLLEEHRANPPPPERRLYVDEVHEGDHAPKLAVSQHTHRPLIRPSDEIFTLLDAATNPLLWNVAVY